MFLCSTKFPVATQDVWLPVNSVLISGFYICLAGEMNDIKGRLLNDFKVFSVTYNVCIVLVIIWLLATLKFVCSLEERPWKAWRGVCSRSSYCLKTILPNEMCQNPPGSSKVTQHWIFMDPVIKCLTVSLFLKAVNYVFCYKQIYQPRIACIANLFLKNEMLISASRVEHKGKTNCGHNCS